jgi:hypothetical protein
MDLADDCRSIILLNDGETFAGLDGCEIIIPTQEEAERI